MENDSTSTPVTPLDLETRPTVPLAIAAHYLHRKPQTMRLDACRQTGPVPFLRVGGRLHCKTADIRRVLGV